MILTLFNLGFFRSPSWKPSGFRYSAGKSDEAHRFCSIIFQKASEEVASSGNLTENPQIAISREASPSIWEFVSCEPGQEACSRNPFTSQSPPSILAVFSPILYQSSQPVTSLRIEAAVKASTYMVWLEWPEEIAGGDLVQGSPGRIEEKCFARTRKGSLSTAIFLHRDRKLAEIRRVRCGLHLCLSLFIRLAI